MKRDMSRTDRKMLSKVLNAENERLQKERPTRGEAIEQLTKKYQFRITHGGFEEVQDIKGPAFKWVPKPTRMPNPNTRNKRILNQVVDVIEEMNMTPNKPFAELLDTVARREKQKTVVDIEPIEEQPKVDSWDKMPVEV